jgi:hypothetical protein
MALLPTSLWAQTTNWIPGNNIITSMQGVNIGIGTNSPLAPLHVNGLSGVASFAWNTYTVARFSDGGQDSHSAILFDTGGSGPTGLRGLAVLKGTQDLWFGRYDSTGQGAPAVDMTIASSGKVGIGTMSPQALLHVYGASGNPKITVEGSASALFPLLQLTDDRTGASTWNIENGREGLGSLGFHSSTAPAGTKVVITSSGSVGIGTTTPQHLLHVAGIIGAEEVIVSSTGADYVFDPKYKLKPLSEVSEYIQENHHLPDVPSAKEVQEKGVGVGEMQTKLLAKIEELTLHLVEMDKKNRELQARVESLEAQKK